MTASTAPAPVAPSVPAPGPVVLDVQDVTRQFARGVDEVFALRGVSLQVRAGEFVAIMGASGSGKSTLMHLCGALDTPTSGRVLVEGTDLSGLSDRQRTLFRRRRMGIIFQAFNLLPTLTAAENVVVPLLVDGVNGAKLRTKADELIELVHLGHRRSHRPDALSGGEQQRVAVARALCNDPALILADEPTGNLDSRNAVEIWKLLARLSRELGKTVVMITHEAAGAATADRVVVLRDGQVCGQIESGGRGDSALVAARYAELVA